MRLCLPFVAVTVALTTMSSAALADGPTFGSAGQLAISSDANLTLTHTTESSGIVSTTSFTLLPSADYFVIDGLSLGGYLLLHLDSETNTPTTTTTLGIGPRIGYNFTFNDTFSFWPKVGIGIDHTSVDGNGEMAVTASIYAPLLVHPAPHFFLGLGPIFSTDLTNSLSTPTTRIDQPKTTTFGLAFTVGGWLAL